MHIIEKILRDCFASRKIIRFIEKRQPPVSRPLWTLAMGQAGSGPAARLPFATAVGGLGLGYHGANGSPDQPFARSGAASEGCAAALARSKRHSDHATPPITKAPPAICARVGGCPPIASSAIATTGTRLV